MDKIPEIKGREQDIRISGRYEKRKDVSESKDREYVDIHKERKQKNKKEKEKEKKKQENKLKSSNYEPAVKSASINRPAKNNKYSDKSEKKFSITFFVNST